MLKKIFIGLILCTVLVGSIILDVEYSYDLANFSSLLFITLIIGLICLSGEARTKCVGKWLITYSIVVLLVSNVISMIQMNYTLKTTDKIIAALEKYKLQKGEYPVDLNALVPKYIHEIPKTSMGWGRREYYYHSFNERPLDTEHRFIEKENYTLSFTMRALIACRYTSNNKSWRCED